MLKPDTARELTLITGGWGWIISQAMKHMALAKTNSRISEVIRQRTT